MSTTFANQSHSSPIQVFRLLTPHIQSNYKFMFSIHFTTSEKHLPVKMYLFLSSSRSDTWVFMTIRGETEGMNSPERKEPHLEYHVSL